MADLVADKASIRDVVDLYYHLVDEDDVSGLRNVFSDDVAIDSTDFGGGVRRGIEQVIAGFDVPPPRMVRAHMGTNSRISVDRDEATAITKCIAWLDGGTVGVAMHNDRLRRTADGWRIYERVLTMPPPAKAAKA